MNTYILIFAIVLVESIAQYNIKKYQENQKTYYYVLAISFYSIIVFILNKLYKKTSMGLTQILSSGFSSISILIVGKYFFGEEIDKYEWLGIFLILLGVIITKIKNISI